MQHKTLIVPFEAWHLDILNPQEEQSIIRTFAESYVQNLEQYGQILGHLSALDSEGNKIAWTAMIDGRILAVGGIMRMLPHVGEAWTVFDKDFFQCPKEDIKFVLSTIKKNLDNCKLQRIQATTEIDFTRADLFLRKLGFVHEGILEDYGFDGKHHNLYRYKR